MSLPNTLKPYQQRIIDERDQLAERREKLCAFLKSENSGELNSLDKTLLDVQLATMGDYLRILDKRISRF